MNERLLQYIWQNQYYDRQQLESLQGENLLVLHPGKLNTHQGADFTGARIKIDDTEWVGQVELHIKSSDWNKHGHGTDPNYNNVILHVVWENDEPLNEGLPLLELQHRVPGVLLNRYWELMHSPSFIPCQALISKTDPQQWITWLSRLSVERLERKAAHVQQLAERCRYHWEQVYWIMLARVFGGVVNGDAFEELAASISIQLLQRYREDAFQLEALLFGQAGMLSGRFRELYPSRLKTEYRHLRKKHSLEAISQPVHYLRMRPGSFPTVRIAQLAAYLKQHQTFLAVLLEEENLEKVRAGFAVIPGEYWLTHYRFEDKGEARLKQAGQDTTAQVMINALIPFLYAYGKYHSQEKLIEKSLKWLGELKAEENQVSRGFSTLNLKPRNALQSQALLELRNEYCNKKRCLECTVGNAILCY